MPAAATIPTTDFLPCPPRLTADEEQELAARRVAGDAAARERLILANVPLAMKRAAAFRGGRHSRYLPDLVSVAIGGLIHAVDKYQPGYTSRGRVVRFSTYAVRWIDQRLGAAESEDLALIRIPLQTVVAMAHDRKGRLPRQFDTPGYRDAIACAKLTRRASAVGLYGDTADELETLVARMDGDMEGAGEPDAAHPGLHAALARLAEEHPREYGVVAMVHPLDGSPVRELNEVAATIGKTREWARTCYFKGLKSLEIYLRRDGSAPSPAGAREAS